MFAGIAMISLPPAVEARDVNSIVVLAGLKLVCNAGGLLLAVFAKDKEDTYGMGI